MRLKLAKNALKIHALIMSPSCLYQTFHYIIIAIFLPLIQVTIKLLRYLLLTLLIMTQLEKCFRMHFLYKYGFIQYFQLLNCDKNINICFMALQKLLISNNELKQRERKETVKCSQSIVAQFTLSQLLAYVRCTVIIVFFVPMC